MFFLTYAKCDVDLERLRDFLVDKFKAEDRVVAKWIIASEKHQDGDLHRHVFIQLEQEFRKKMRSSWLDIDGKHPNVEHVRSGKKVMAYCTKEGDYITNMKLQEVRPSRNEIAAEIIKGRQLKELVLENPALIFGYSRLKGDISAFKMDQAKPEALDSTCGLWLCGPAGCGKTTIATTKFGNYYIKDKSKWWDGYSGEETVVADDVDVTWKDLIPYFKWWADKHPFKGEVKGGMVELRPKRFVVTSNKTLEELLELISWDKSDYAPYTRRFRVQWFTSIQEWEDDL